MQNENPSVKSRDLRTTLHLFLDSQREMFKYDLLKAEGKNTAKNMHGCRVRTWKFIKGAACRKQATLLLGVSGQVRN